MKITDNTGDDDDKASAIKDPNPHRTHRIQKPRPRRRSSPRVSTPRVAVSRRSSKKDGATARPGPPTPPPVRWKFDEGVEASGLRGEAEDVESKKRRGRGGDVSVRRLGGRLWRLWSPEPGDGGGGGGDGERRGLREESRLGFQPRVGKDCDPLSCHHERRHRAQEARDPLGSPCSVNSPIDGYLNESSFQFSVMEGATKWNPVSAKASFGNPGNLHISDSKQNHTSTVSSFQAELEKAKQRIEELEAERKFSKKKMDQFLRKLSEERSAWRSKEHDKIRAFIDDTRADLKREKKSCQRLEIVNAKLVNDLAEAKLSAKRYMQECDKERKARLLVEEVCDELAKEIGEDKAEADALKKECTRLREEMEEEKKMLQMAEVWREERVQMKLVDAKVTLHEKYLQMNKLILELETFLRTRSSSLTTKELKEVEILRQAAASIRVQDLKELTYEPPNPDDIFSVFEEMAMAGQHERDIEQCIAHSPSSPSSKMHVESHDLNYPSNKSQRPFISYTSKNGLLDDDRSGWETVSQGDDQGSSYSPEGSSASVNKTGRDSNVSGSCTDWEINLRDGAPVTEISEVFSKGVKQSKKVSSISRLWRSGPDNGEIYKIVSVDGKNCRISNGRISSASIISPDDGCLEVGLNRPDLPGQWSPTDSIGSKAGRGKKGCIEWPITMQKGSFKHKLIDSKVDGQKIQLRHVLKQNI
ncbi:hypothetical protein Droror1_Dr00014244 [Drosera rotundifolia]